VNRRQKVRRGPLAVAALVAAAAVHAQAPAPRVRPPADPLAPWPLEDTGLPAPVPAPPPLPAPADTALRALPAAPRASADSGEVVLVVHTRQILVSDPTQAGLLERLLQRGVAFETAQRTLGITEVDERRREYAVDELEPRIRAEIEALPDSAWSRGRPWRGRTAFFQVLRREERRRGSVPPLGENLDDKERSRLANLYRAAERPATAPPPGVDPDLVPAAVVDQVKAEFPPAASESGEVTLAVEVGRIGDVVSVRVESSTHPIFEPPAIAAARASTYRAAMRAGLPEPGTVRLTYRFAAPASAESP
jgi:TonB family protein